MLPDRVSNPGPLTYESGALPTALRGLAHYYAKRKCYIRSTQAKSNGSTKGNIVDQYPWLAMMACRVVHLT